LAISRAKKEELVKTYQEHIENTDAMVFTNYRGISVTQIQTLRNKLRENDSVYMVIKNRLFSIALEQANRPQPDGLLEGPNAVVFLGEDISKGVKALEDWIREEEIVEIKGGLLESSLLDPAGVEALGDLPTREEVLALILATLTAPPTQMVRQLNAPADQLVRVLNASVSSLFNVINARVQQLQEES